MAPVPSLPDNRAMDETPEELEQIRREAAEIDIYKYRKRRRAMMAAGLGAVSAGAVWLVLEMSDKSRNPCERVRDHFCKADPTSANCKTYDDVLQQSIEEPGPKMRSLIRDQCLTKIKRMAAEDGVKVR
jgi:hypothetical protein